MTPYEAFELLYPYLNDDFFKLLKFNDKDIEIFLSKYQEYCAIEVYNYPCMRSDAIHYILLEIKDEKLRKEENAFKAKNKKGK